MKKQLRPKKKQVLPYSPDDLKRIMVQAIKTQAITSWGKISYIDSSSLLH